MNQQYQVRQCTAPACRLRFPAHAEQLPSLGCPACGAATVVCIESVARGEHCGMAVAASRNAAAGLRCSDAQWAGSARSLSIIVDNVRSLYNVGSIFRSADGAGIDHLYLCGITPTPANPKLAKTALGAESTVAWTHLNNSLDCITPLRRQGYTLWALEETEAAISIFDALLPDGPLALVIGNEVTGIDPALIAEADAVVALPMYGVKRSLNVATAFGAAAILLTHRMHGQLQPNH